MLPETPVKEFSKWRCIVWNHDRYAAGVQGAAGDPAGYTYSVDNTEHVVYRVAVTSTSMNCGSTYRDK